MTCPVCGHKLVEKEFMDAKNHYKSCPILTRIEKVSKKVKRSKICQSSI
jgi:hypothetical protein